jgi:hypothetical protein
MRPIADPSSESERIVAEVGNFERKAVRLAPRIATAALESMIVLGGARTPTGPPPSQWSEAGNGPCCVTAPAKSLTSRMLWLEDSKVNPQAGAIPWRTSPAGAVGIEGVPFGSHTVPWLEGSV